MRQRFVMCNECYGTGKEAQEKQIDVDVFVEVPFEDCDDCKECDGQGSVLNYEDTIFNHAGAFYLEAYEKQKELNR